VRKNKIKETQSINRKENRTENGNNLLRKIKGDFYFHKL